MVERPRPSKRATIASPIIATTGFILAGVLIVAWYWAYKQSTEAASAKLVVSIAWIGVALLIAIAGYIYGFHLYPTDRARAAERKKSTP